MIDMKLYEDINRLYPIESMSLDSNSTQDPLSPPSRSRGNWFKKIFKFKRQVHTFEGGGVWLVRGRHI
jgi:hypothetical protein